MYRITIEPKSTEQKAEQALKDAVQAFHKGEKDFFLDLSGGSHEKLMQTLGEFIYMAAWPRAPIAVKVRCGTILGGLDYGLDVHLERD